MQSLSQYGYRVAQGRALGEPYEFVHFGIGVFQFAVTNLVSICVLLLLHEHGGQIHWQPSFAFTRLDQLRRRLPPHFGVIATGVILGGLAASSCLVTIRPCGVSDAPRAR